MGYGTKSAIPHGRYDYEKEYALLNLVFIWLKEHSLIVLLLLGTIFNVFLAVQDAAAAPRNGMPY